MGRTIHYRIRGPRELTGAEGYELGDVARLMNERFTWSSEQLRLDFTAPSSALDRGRPEDTRAWGFTKVGADEWNAYLVVRFLLWASATLPEHTIEVHDEGRYITAGHILVRHGVPEVDLPRLRDIRARNERVNYPTAWVDEAIACGERGELFAKLPLAEYRGRVRELADVEVTREELEGDVDVVAERLLEARGVWVPIRT